MFCEFCGTRLDEDAQFCDNCGHPVTRTQGSTDVGGQTTVLQGQQPVQDSQTQVLQQPQTQQPQPQQFGGQQVPAQLFSMPTYAAPEYGTQQNAVSRYTAPQEYTQPYPGGAYQGMQYQGGQSPTGPMSMMQPPVQSPIEPQEGDQSTPRKKRNRTIIIAIIAVIVVLALAGTGGFLWWRHQNSQAQQASNSVAAQKGDTKKSESKDDDKKDKKDEESKECVSSLQFEPQRLRQQGAEHSAVVSGTFTSSCDTYTLDNSSTSITLSDDHGIVAAAAFDFSERPIEITDGESGSVSLYFTREQSFVPVHDSSITVQAEVKLDAETRGKAPATQAGRRSGASVLSDDEIEQASKAALEREIASDKEEAQQFMSTFTTQLSSKIEGMNAEGKTWTSKDIWEDFLNYSDRYSGALLIWSSDWPNYTKGGNSSSYYVVLSGDSFGSIDAGNGWCAGQGLDKDHCLVVDLS